MRQRIRNQLFVLIFLISSGAVAALQAQEPASFPPSETTSPAPVETTRAAAPANSQIIVPTGTHLPLMLRNGINTRTAKAGDSVYFETAYPIGVNSRMAIPMGTFVRGEITEAKRPGRIRGRGEFRIVLNQMTYVNGYTVDLRASPRSLEDARQGVTQEGKITGPSGVGKDVSTLLLATAVGGPAGGYAGVLAGSPNRASLAIGHGAGAAAGLVLVLLMRGPEAELSRGMMMDVVFNRPLILDEAYLPRTNTAGVDPQPTYAPVPLDARQRRKETQEKRLRQSMLLHSLLFFPL